MCRPSILSLQHMSLNLFSVLQSNSLVAHYYSYNLPFSESPRRLWLRDYLTPYCDPWQSYSRLRFFHSFLGQLLGTFRPTQAPLAQPQAHLGSPKPFQTHFLYDLHGPHRIDYFIQLFCFTLLIFYFMLIFDRLQDY